MNLIRPDVALFGQKDAQQLAVIRTFVRDLDMPVRIQAVEIVRDSDGVALSSRNQYLSEEERVHARSLSRAIDEARAAAALGVPLDEVLRAASSVLEAEAAAARASSIARDSERACTRSSSLRY